MQPCLIKEMVWCNQRDAVLAVLDRVASSGGNATLSNQRDGMVQSKRRRVSCVRQGCIISLAGGLDSGVVVSLVPRAGRAQRILTARVVWGVDSRRMAKLSQLDVGAARWSHRHSVARSLFQCPIAVPSRSASPFSALFQCGEGGTTAAVSLVATSDRVGRLFGCHIRQG